MQERKTLGVFPYGSRQSDQIHDGALRFAHRASVPIVTVGIDGTLGDISGLKKGHRPSVAVAIGDPWMVENRKDTARLAADMAAQKARAVKLNNYPR